MKIGKTVAILLAITIALFTIAIAAAAYQYSQTVTWTYQPTTESFWVTNNDPQNYGVLTEQTTFTRTYQVVNDGTVPITLVASTSGFGFTANWDKTTATLQPQETATFTLTLTVTDAGSCTVNINLA